jgi:hypothetical protein
MPIPLPQGAGQSGYFASFIADSLRVDWLLDRLVLLWRVGASSRPQGREQIAPEALASLLHPVAWMSHVPASALQSNP